MPTKTYLTLMAILASLLVLTACNLAEDTTEEAILEAGAEAAIGVTIQPTTMMAAETTPEPNTAVENVVQDSTDTGNATSTPQTNTTRNTASTNNTSNTSNTGCTPRIDLGIYTVVSGDTLYSIATAHNSTVADLSSYNCLADNNIISVGQQLYVPNANTSNNQALNNNAASSATESSAPSVTTGNNPDPATLYPILSPYVTVVEHSYRVTQGDTLYLTFYGGSVQDGTTQVEFIYTPDATPNTNISIGIDSDFSDGIEVAWTPPDSILGTVTVAGRYPGQTHEGFTSQAIRVESVDSVIGPMGALMATPNIQAGTPQDWGDFIV